MPRDERISSLFPGSVATNAVVLVIGAILAAMSMYPVDNKAISSLLAGFGSAMFLAGFLGLINVRVLAREVGRVAGQPFEDVAYLNKMRQSGVRDVFRDRSESVEPIMTSLKHEADEFVIVGSSLKGLIGVGYSAVGAPKRIRTVLDEALCRGVKINILMTNPVVAHHRSQQEGRLDGDIEAEILENLMYFVMWKSENPDLASCLEIELYDGAPTIFMLCTSQLMLLNPYPYYSTAFSSFSFLIEGNSPLYRAYYNSHFREAWADRRSTLRINDNLGMALTQIKEIIGQKNPHGRLIIPDEGKRQELLDKLGRISDSKTGRFVNT